MTTPPDLFDIDLLARRRARLPAPETFLHREAAARVSERLIEVNRSFSAPAVIGWQAPVWAEELAGNPRLSGAPALVEDTEVLALERGAQDLVVHGLGLHWSRDPVGTLIQMRLGLKPDGLMLAVSFGGQTLHELRAALAEAEVERAGGLSPRVAPMAEIRDLGALLQRAGFAMPVADTERLTVTYASPLNLMRELRAMGEGNVMRQRRRVPLRRDVLLRACEIYQARWAGADGRVPATFDLVFLTGWAPSADQPVPKRPGSAVARLADALGTAERSAGQKAGED
ncbi:SAM-dependent methyltransferase [Paroceanicella profunda]|uniref:SAM-dependent methyltransferase n=2 Tax=Paroceanicella profunda TaxID=2579971 RepID=A0A5B8G0Y7_9RHOB|nr:SAM-dependent methyltransferase [Paroceanicella profunda]QDL93674.1 SAM-dependent methyltransferase [Paroceanicella profunda]